MSNEIKIAEFQVSGWKAVALLVGLVAFMGYSAFGSHDVTDNTELKRALRLRSSPR